MTYQARTTAWEGVFDYKAGDVPAVPNRRLLTKKRVFYEVVERRFFGTF